MQTRDNQRSLCFSMYGTQKKECPFIFRRDVVKISNFAVTSGSIDLPSPERETRQSQKFDLF